MRISPGGGSSNKSRRVAHFGSEEQKRRFLPAAAAGECILAVPYRSPARVPMLRASAPAPCRMAKTGLPITGLAEAIPQQNGFIGLHFFSPVNKMQLVEIIRGAKTDEATLARAFDYVLQIKKVPLVVNDARGFITSRVFGTFVNEGMAMLGEGANPALIENIATQAGMPVGPLAVSDEVSMILMKRIRKQTADDLAAEGKAYPTHAADAVVDRMVDEFKRPGRAAGGGFYEYPADGRKRLWPELAKKFSNGHGDIPGRRARSHPVRAGDRNRARIGGGRVEHHRRRQHRWHLRHWLRGLDRRSVAVHQPVRAECFRRSRALSG